MPDSPTSEPESVFVCACKDWMRSACAGEPFYKEHEGKRYCVFHSPLKEKSADFEKALQRKLESKDFNFRGVWFPDPLLFLYFDFATDVDFRSAIFSADVNLSCATFVAKASFDKATFSAKANFGSAIFGAEAHFNSATFSEGATFSMAKFIKAAHFGSTTFNAEADFNSADFTKAANFGSTTFGAETNFHNAIFRAEAKFYEAAFQLEANFHSVIFSKATRFQAATFDATASFDHATFRAEALFSSATFSAAADFISATFSAEADFRYATFADHVRFARDENHPVFTDTSRLDLQFARIEKPDRVSFHTLSLRPHWFVNVDPRRFEFTNVDWDWRSINEEVEGLKGKNVSSPHRMLAIACRRLAINAEEHHRYEEASRFRYLAMEARRLESWRGLAFWRLSWWYWLASGYGERVWQAFFVLLGILLLSALLYNHVGFARWEPKVASESDVVDAKRDDVGAPLKFSRALTYSAAVMIVQRPEPRPATTAAQTVVLLETILGPVQAALLALAIRRKFMR